MNTVYLRFLTKNVLKKWSFWIVGILYILFTAIFLLMVPAILKTTPFVIWSNTMMSPQVMLMYVGALLSAILSISIFRDYRDNGTELIVVSKPINRQKIVFSKLIIFIISSIGFALASCLICLFTLTFNEVSGYQAFSLMSSVFIANAIFCLIFGFIATVVSLFLNKIWTILLNVVFIVLMVIFHTVSQFVIKDPAQLANDGGHGIQSIRYCNNQGEVQNAVAISPNINNNPASMDDIIDIKNIDGEKDKWNGYRNKSHANVANYFDFVSQFQYINNEFGMQDYVNEQATNSFGSNRWCDYKINDRVLADSKSQPLFYTQINHKLATPNKDEPLPFIANLITSQNIIMLGNASTSGSLIPTGAIAASRGFFVGQGHNGINTSRHNTVNYTWNDLVANADEHDAFTDILDSIISNDSAFNWSAEPNVLFPAGGLILSPLFTFGNDVWGNTCNNVYDYVHDELAGMSWINNSLSTLMLESLKFRFFVYQNACEALYDDSYYGGDRKYANDAPIPPTYEKPFPSSTVHIIDASPILPVTDDNIGKLSDTSVWKSKYFTYEYYWKWRTLADWAIDGQSLGFSSTTIGNHDRDYSYNSYLLTTSLNFTLGYQLLMATYTNTPEYKSWLIAIDWLLATIVIGCIATIIYWKTDFK